MADLQPKWGSGAPTTMSLTEALYRTSRLADRDWLNPIAMQELQTALKEKSATVTFDGIVFNIKYYDDFVFLQPSEGRFTPCGSVSYETIRNFRFEE